MSYISIQNLANKRNVKFGTSGLRGLVRSLSPEVCFLYSKAFLQSQDFLHKTVAIAQDLRPSSTAIAEACHAGALSAGFKIDYLGEIPTPGLALYCFQKNIPGIMITGSHIPFDRNGLKFYKPDGEISKADENIITKSLVTIDNETTVAKLPTINHEAENLFVSRYLDFYGDNYLKNKTIAIYQHSSVARDILDRIFKSLGAKTIRLGRSDSFVPIDTEAVRDEDHAQAKKWALDYEFDMLVSTDGDGDRPLIADENGVFFRGDILGALTAKHLQADHVVTPISSNTSLELSNAFKSVIRTKIGSPFVIEAMKAIQDKFPNSLVCGYEANGGFLINSNTSRNQKTLTALPTRDSIISMLALFGLAKELNSKISDLINILPARYTFSDRLQEISSIESANVIRALKLNSFLLTHFFPKNPGKIKTQNETDGLRITFENDDILHLRPSGNAPELRCYAESNSEANARKIVTLCLEYVNNQMIHGRE